MTDGYQVIIGEIRRASGAVEDAAEIAGKVDLGAAIGPVGQALTGSRAAQSVSKVVPFWKDQVITWSADWKAHAGNLAVTADRYEAYEEQAAADFRISHGDRVGVE